MAMAVGEATATGAVEVIGTVDMAITDTAATTVITTAVDDRFDKISH
jgi:hypothetical protein